MGTDTDIITSNNIIFPAVRDLFARGCVLPNNHILSDIHITVNDDPWTGGQHDTFTSSCARADTPLLCRRPVFLSLSHIFVVVDYLKERFHWPGVTREETALSLHAISDKAANNGLIPRDNAGFPVFREMVSALRIKMWQYGNRTAEKSLWCFFSKKWEHMSFI